MPVIIHSVMPLTTPINDNGIRVDWGKVVFQCFSYGSDEIKKINLLVDVLPTGIVTYKNAPAVREALRAQGVIDLCWKQIAPIFLQNHGEPNEQPLCSRQLSTAHKF